VKRLFQNRILIAYGSSILGVFSGLLTSFWLLREVTQLVTPREFGIYAFAFQITSYLAVLQLGLDFAASREIAACLGRSDPVGANAVYSELRRFNHRVSFGVAVLVLVSGVASILFGWHGFPPEESNLIAQVILVAGGAQVLSALARPYSAALIGGMHQVVTNLVQVGSGVLTALVGYGFLLSGAGVLCLPLAGFAVGCLTMFFLRFQAGRRCLWLDIGSVPRNLVALRELVRFGGMASAGGLAWTIESTSDVVLLGALGGAQVVALYVIWWRFPQMIFDLCTRLALSAFPHFSHSFGESPAAAKIIFSKVAYLTLGLSTLALVGISFWLRPFVHLWIGADYLGVQSIHLANVMGMLVCLRTCGNLLGMFWLASGHAEFTTALAWAQAVLKLSLAVLLVPQWGILGLVIASCVASLLQVGAMGCFLLRERLLSPGLGWRAIALISLASLVVLPAAHGSMEVGWGGLIAGAIATTLLWTVPWLIVISTSELRDLGITALRGLARRFYRPKSS
jgi:O-antigen/teichoic acid export membrane protein